MEHQEAQTQYARALKLGQKYYHNAAAHGGHPYPPVLDRILGEMQTAGTVELGLADIPTERIVGTKTAGRQNAFAGNFMPLLPADSEFGSKWIALCESHLDIGIHDPIRCYEYLGQFYVQEGNKRVSVLKSYGAPTIPGNVTRVLPVYSDAPEIRQYFEFLDFYRLSKLYTVMFTISGGYAKLQAAMGFDPDHVWTKDEREQFRGSFSLFRYAAEHTGQEIDASDVSDLFLCWLDVYAFTDIRNMTSDELSQSIAALVPDMLAQKRPHPIEVETEPKSPEINPLVRLFGIGLPSHLKVAFIHGYDPEKSSWTRAHDRGRQYMEDRFGERVEVGTYIAESGKEDDVFQKAAEDGADVIFATTPSLITACRKSAAAHPGIRILNCALALPHPGIRSYYCRIYEAKFITGAIAGAVSPKDTIGYVANYPIFGAIAAINAFALGARLTNPNAQIRLHWTCTVGDPIDSFHNRGIRVISNRDASAPEKSSLAWEWGTYLHRDDAPDLPLASPIWNWGTFYEKVVSSIFDGSFEAHNAPDAAVNYWWGMESGVIDVQLSDALPAGTKQLAEILKNGVVDHTIDPFFCKIYDTDGNLQSDGTRRFSPEELMRMDWLCENVIGRIPGFDDLLPMSQGMVRLLGIYRDSIPPEKEQVQL